MKRYPLAFLAVLLFATVANATNFYRQRFVAPYVPTVAVAIAPVYAAPICSVVQPIYQQQIVQPIVQPVYQPIVQTVLSYSSCAYSSYSAPLALGVGYGGYGGSLGLGIGYGGYNVGAFRSNFYGGVGAFRGGVLGLGAGRGIVRQSTVIRTRSVIRVR